MKFTLKKSGQNGADAKAPKKKKTRKSPARAAREFYEQAGIHFDNFFVKRWQNLKSVRLWILEWGLLNLVVLLLAIVQICWYADAYQTTTFVDGGNYSEATLGAINSMNPLYANTSSEKTLARLLFANLMSPDTTGHMKGELAKQVKKVDGDAAKWRLTLRDNLYWSDGEPITSDDLLYTIELIENDAAKTTIGVDFGSVKINKIDEKTVEFELPAPYVDFTDSLEFPLVPKHVLGDIDPSLVFESNFSKEPVCSGVFKVNATQTANSSSKALQTVFLQKNDKYFLGGTRLDSFTIKAYGSVADIKEAFENSDVTATAELEDNENFARTGVAKRESYLNAGAYAFLNTKSDVLKEVKVRKAIQEGANIALVRGDEYGHRGIDYPILENQFEGLSYPKLPSYNLDNAKTLLTDAGYSYDGDMLKKDGQNVVLKLAYQDSSELGPVAERYAEELRKLGFDVSVSVFGEAEIQAGQNFYSMMIQPRNYDVLVQEINLGVSVDPFVYYSSQQANEHGWNLSNYSNRMVDDALLSARTTTDKELRKAKYESFLEYWVNDVPAVGLYRSNLNYYYSDGVQIYAEDVMMTDEFDRFADVRNFASKKGKVNLTP